MNSNADTGDTRSARRSRVYSFTGVTLRHHVLGETDQIVTVLTREYGRRRFVAKGARRPGNRFAGQFEPGSVVNATAATSRSLDIVSQATLTRTFRRLRSDMSLIGYLSMMLDLTNSLVADDEPVPRVFDLLVLAMELLDGGSAPLKVLLLLEFGLLREVGYRPELYACIRCNRALEQTVNGFSFEGGGVLCHECRGLLPSESLDSNAVKVLRLLDRGEFRRFERIDISEPVLQSVDSVLAGFVRSITGKDSPSRRVIREMHIGYDEYIETRTENKGVGDGLH